MTTLSAGPRGLTASRFGCSRSTSTTSSPPARSLHRDQLSRPLHEPAIVAPSVVVGNPTRRIPMPDLSPEALSPFLRESGLVFENMTRTEVTGTIDAGPDHHTPWGVVHGGLYATAVESTTSVGASLAVADEGMFAVGLTNQTDFIRAHTEGRLNVKAWPIHQGRTGQLWQCDITREDGKLVAQGRVRLQNVPKPSDAA